MLKLCVTWFVKNIFYYSLHYNLLLILQQSMTAVESKLSNSLGLKTAEWILLWNWCSVLYFDSLISYSMSNNKSDMIYSLQDYCSNTLNGSFRVITENIPCGTTGTTCSKSIKIFLVVRLSHSSLLASLHFSVIISSSRWQAFWTVNQ